MMSQEEGENGFELVDRPREGNIVNDGPTPLPMWLPQPVVMPTAGPSPIVLPVSGNPFPSTSTPVCTSAPSQSFPVPVSVTPVSQIPAPVPLMLPELGGIPIVSPVMVESHFQQSSVSSLNLAMMESPSAVNMSANASVSSTQEEPESSNAGSGGGGLFSWVKGAMPGKQILAKVAEKARSSMDYAITTLDPQMKEIIYSGGSVDVTVTTNKEVKVSAVREAFQSVFGKATIRGCELSTNSSDGEIAVQPVGFAAAIGAAEERIKAARTRGLIDARQTVVSVEGFAVELFPDNWFEMNCLLLEDPARNVRLQTFSQPLMIPMAAVQRMRSATPASHPQRSTGFALTVGQAVADEFNVAPTEWQVSLTGISRREVLVLAAKTLASAYK